MYFEAVIGNMKSRSSPCKLGTALDASFCPNSWRESRRGPSQSLVKSLTSTPINQTFHSSQPICHFSCSRFGSFSARSNSMRWSSFRTAGYCACPSSMPILAPFLTCSDRTNMSSGRVSGDSRWTRQLIWRWCQQYQFSSIILVGVYTVKSILAVAPGWTLEILSSSGFIVEKTELICSVKC